MAVPKFDFTEALKAVAATDKQAQKLMCGAKKVLERCPRCTRPTRLGKCPKCNPYEYNAASSLPELREDVEKRLSAYKASLDERKREASLESAEGSSKSKSRSRSRSRSRSQERLRKKKKKRRRKEKEKSKKRRKKRKREKKRRDSSSTS